MSADSSDPQIPETTIRAIDDVVSLKWRLRWWTALTEHQPEVAARLMAKYPNTLRLFLHPDQQLDLTDRRSRR